MLFRVEYEFPIGGRKLGRDAVEVEAESGDEAVRIGRERAEATGRDVWQIVGVSVSANQPDAPPPPPPPPPEVVPEPVPEDERTTLQRQAEAMGIRVMRTWTALRIRSEIAATRRRRGR